MPPAVTLPEEDSTAQVQVPQTEEAWNDFVTKCVVHLGAMVYHLLLDSHLSQ